MAEFDPGELDLLEDALEDLESTEDIGTLGLDMALAERLGEYQSILHMSRDAFPMEDVPAGLLDGVLEQARESAATPTTAAGPSWWSRWRRRLVPSLALAGSAAVVLLILRPEDAMEQANAPVETASGRDDARKADDAKRDVDGGAAPADVTEEEEAEPERAADAPQSPPPEPAVSPKPAPRPGAAPAKKKKRKKKIALGGGANDPLGDLDPPTPAPAKDDTYSKLSQADRKRRSGSCTAARRLYQEIIDANPPANQLARAHAGKALCLEYEGRDTAAESSFEAARNEDSSIGEAWLERERLKMPSPEERKASSAKKAKKSKNAAAMDDL